MEDIFKKFKFKDLAIAINTPENLKSDLNSLELLSFLNENLKSRNTLIFVNNSAEFIFFLTNHLKNIERDSVLWFAYPKGTSGIKTDINRDILRATAEKFNLTTVAAISINETWSALRLRPIDCVGK